MQRIIGNITHEVVFSQVQEYIPDAKEKIVSGVKRAIAKDLSYYVFRQKDAWDKEEALGTTYLKEAMKENKEMFKQKIKDYMINYDASKDIKDEISGEFKKMASTLYDLSELFSKK